MTAYATINNKSPLEDGEEELTEMPRLKKQRQAWMQEEKNFLMEYFNLTSTSKAPKQEECVAFLMQRDGTDGLFGGRTKKEVQDKCRTIISQLKKTIG